MRNLLEPEHLLVILLIVVVLFGGRRLPEIGAALGRGIRDFRRAVDAGPEDGRPTPPLDPTRVGPTAATATLASVERPDVASAPKRLRPPEG